MLQYSLLFLAFTVIITVKCGSDSSAAASNTFTCKTKFGAYPNEDDCSKFWLCLNGNAYPKDCVKGKHFSAELGYCTKPEDAKCEKETTTAAAVEKSKVKLGSTLNKVKIPTIAEAVTALHNLFTDDEMTTEHTIEAENQKVAVAEEVAVVKEEKEHETAEKKSDSESKKSDKKENEEKEADANDVNDVVDNSTEKPKNEETDVKVEEVKVDVKAGEENEVKKGKDGEEAAVDASAKVVDVDANVDIVRIDKEEENTSSSDQIETENKPKKDKKKHKEEKTTQESNETEQFEMASTEKEETTSNVSEMPKEQSSDEKVNEGEQKENVTPNEDEQSTGTEKSTPKKKSKSTEKPISNDASTEKSETDSQTEVNEKSHKKSEVTEQTANEEVKENSTQSENSATTTEGPFVCPLPDGMFPHTKSCRLFFHCSNGIPHVKMCPGSLQWNAVLSICDWPEMANCTKNKKKPSKKLQLLDLSEFINVPRN